MSEKAYWLPRYCREWLADTRHLSCEVRGAYGDLLDHQWLDGWLADDLEELQRRAGATDKEWRRIWPKLEPYFPVDRDGMRRNGKLERVRVKHLGKAKNGSKGGSASASEHASESASKPPSEQASTDASKLPAPLPALDIRHQSQTSTATAAAPSRAMARLINRLQGDAERWQVEQFFHGLPAGEQPDRWAAILVGCLDGLGLAEGKACTPGQLAAACAAYPQVVKDGTWSERHFRRCVENVMRTARVQPTGDAIDRALNERGAA